MDDWMTERMRRAGQGMDAAAARIDRTVAEVDARLAEANRRRARREDEEGRAWRALAEAPDAPAEWRRVVQRVRQGELCWADVAAGRLAADADLAAAVLASTAPPEPVAIRRGTPAEDVHDDEPVTILRRR